MAPPSQVFPHVASRPPKTLNTLSLSVSLSLCLSLSHSLTLSQVFPRVASRPPKLLQELEAILIDRLRANDKVREGGVLTQLIIKYDCVIYLYMGGGV